MPILRLLKNISASIEHEFVSAKKWVQNKVSSFDDSYSEYIDEMNDELETLSNELRNYEEPNTRPLGNQQQPILDTITQIIDILKKYYGIKYQQNISKMKIKLNAIDQTKTTLLNPDVSRFLKCFGEEDISSIHEDKFLDECSSFAKEHGDDKQFNRFSRLYKAIRVTLHNFAAKTITATGQSEEFKVHQTDFYQIKETIDIVNLLLKTISSGIKTLSYAYFCCISKTLIPLLSRYADTFSGLPISIQMKEDTSTINKISDFLTCKLMSPNTVTFSMQIKYLENYNANNVNTNTLSQNLELVKPFYTPLIRLLNKELRCKALKSG